LEPGIKISIPHNLLPMTSLYQDACCPPGSLWTCGSAR